MAENEGAKKRMMLEVEKVKINLSTQYTTEARLLSLLDGHDFKLELTSAWLREEILVLLLKSATQSMKFWKKQESKKIKLLA